MEESVTERDEIDKMIRADVMIYYRKIGQMISGGETLLTASPSSHKQ
jgi:hypothetical protein